MRAKPRPQIDVEHLRRLAGEKTFRRGEDYYAGGRVDILACETARIVAQVGGSENYSTIVTGYGRDIGGGCSCPAFEDMEFCKHMIAVALAANDLDEHSPAVGALSRIREYLRRKEKAPLLRIITSLAERDADLFRRLHRAAAGERPRQSAEATRIRRARAD